jgi:hypothetical protein
MKVKELRKE